MCVCIPFSLTQSIAFSRSLAAMMCTIYKQEKHVYIYIYMHAYVFGLSVVYAACIYIYICMHMHTKTLQKMLDT